MICTSDKKKQSINVYMYILFRNIHYQQWVTHTLNSVEYTGHCGLIRNIRTSVVHKIFSIFTNTKSVKIHILSLNQTFQVNVVTRNDSWKPPEEDVTRRKSIRAEWDSAECQHPLTSANNRSHVKASPFVSLPLTKSFPILWDYFSCASAFLFFKRKAREFRH